MEDFFGEVVVVDKENKGFESNEITHGFHLVMPSYIQMSKDWGDGMVVPEIIFTEDKFENESKQGFELPTGEKADGPIGTYKLAFDKRNISEWSTKPPKEVVFEIGSNLIAIFNRMSPDIEKKYRQSIAGINPVTDFMKFLEVSNDFLKKPLKKVWVKVRRTQKKNDPRYFYYNLDTNKIKEGLSQFVVINQANVKSTEKDDDGVIVALSYAKEDGVIKTLKFDYNSTWDNKMLPPEATAMDEGFDDMPNLNMGEEEDELAF